MKKKLFGLNRDLIGRRLTGTYSLDTIYLDAGDVLETIFELARDNGDVHAYSQKQKMNIIVPKVYFLGDHTTELRDIRNRMNARWNRFGLI